MFEVDKHELIVKLKELAIEMGRTPTAIEFTTRVPKTKFAYTREFGNYAMLVHAAELEPVKNGYKSARTLIFKEENKLLKQYAAICGRREKIQGFYRHVLDLKELFERAGNPPVLKVAFQPDTHAKFVDRPAFQCYLKFLSYYKPDVRIIGGDFVDCEGLTHWPSKDLEPRRIVPEMKIARGLLQELEDATPSCSTKIFLEGNHERWIQNALAEMPELFDGLDELGIEINVRTLLNLEKFGYSFFPMNELVQIGKAHYVHGIYTGKHHAKKHYDEFKCNLYYGHLHDKQRHNDTNIDGDMEAMSLACLCRLDAKFLKGQKNNWAHGHGVFEFFPSGDYVVYPVDIKNGLSSYNGKLFDGNI